MIIIYEQTEMNEEMKKRLGDVMCVAPWTKLDLRCEFEIIGTRERGKKVMNVIMVQNRHKFKSRRIKNDK